MALIPLRKRDGSTRAYALIDDADLPLVSQHRWRLFGRGYVQSTIDGTPVSLHRFLLGLGHGDPREGDHINRDKLDHRRSNLRIVTQLHNAQNVPARGPAGVRGVCFDKRRGLWFARAGIAGRYHYVGRFATLDAARAAVEAYRAAHMPGSIEALRSVA